MALMEEQPEWTRSLQLRLQSINSVHLLAPLGEDLHNVSFTLNSASGQGNDEPLFTSCTKQVRGGCWARWVDVAVDSRLQTCFLTAVFVKRGDKEFKYSWLVHLQGLRCIGKSFDANRLQPRVKVEENEAKTSFVFGMAQHMFAPQTLSFRSEESNSAELASSATSSSYSLSVLQRLLQVQRAVQRKESANEDLRNQLSAKGLDVLSKTSLDPETEVYKPSTVSLRQQVFGNFAKSSNTRRKELRLKVKLEELSFKKMLLQDQLEMLRESIKSTNENIAEISSTVDEQSNRLMSNMHALARDGHALKEWRGYFEDNSRFTFTMRTQLKRLRHQLIRDIHDFIYPLQVHEDKGNISLRWVTLPSLELAKSSSAQETSFSVVLGWMSHVLVVSSIILDLPTRFPMLHQGSMSRVSEQLTQQVFPLFTKNADVARVDLGLFILNKVIAQFAFTAFDVNLSDIKVTLKNWKKIIDLINLELSKDFDEKAGPRGSVMVALPSPMLAPVAFSSTRMNGGSRRASIEGSHRNVNGFDNEEVNEAESGVVEVALDIVKDDNFEGGKADEDCIEEEEATESTKLIPWGDVTSRVDALSTQQTKFHRRKQRPT